ncbi:hypothetical protein [Brevibacillus sp. VP]|uniref:hypothetical protein n=1 Tax=unclassified Brevibacillus TaxID=2684853 RepID=UPI000E2E45B7|nr:hypothetical protein [Brevibacillus sp. VP]RFB28284.1 hypothetical protein DZB91_23980 [Brevibacillus sp. VP]
MKNCFIVSPIGHEGSDTRKRSDQVYKHILTPVCEQCGYNAIRVDKINDTDTINQTIIEHLKASDLVIADLTEHNPNAFYEAGYRAAIGKPLIQLIEAGQDLPFDVSAIRTIFYKLSDPDKLAEAKEKLIETIKTVGLESEDSSTSQLAESPQVSQVHQVNQQIFSLLLDIKDGVENLHVTIKNKEQSDLEGIVSAIQKNSMAPEAKMMEILLPEMLNNPEKFQHLMKLFNQQAPKKKSY